MNCEQMTALLSAYVDGELTAAQEAQVREHLEQCAECRALYEQLQTLHTSFSDLEEIPAPENFAQGVMARIKAEEKPKVIPLFKRPQVRAVMGLAACAVLCIGFGRMTLGNSFKNTAAEQAAPSASAPESAVCDAAEYSIQATSGNGMEARMEISPAEPAAPEMAQPAMPEAPAAMEPMEAPAGVQMDGAAEKSRVCGEIVLEELPEGFEDAAGFLDWEERIEDGAVCAQLTERQMQTLLKMAAGQDIKVQQTAFTADDADCWLLVLAP